MKWMNLLFTRAGTGSGIHISCGILLLNYLIAGQQTGINEKKKTPEDLICYQKYTLKDNFCNCSWRAGEESQDPTYTLHYCVYRDYTECQSFNAGKQTYITLTNDDVHMREIISVEVTAEEHGQNYTSKPITLILDKAVKLDPPDHNKITVTREGSNITVSWTRINLFPMFFKTAKEVRYKEHPLYPDPLPCKTSTSTTCQPGRDGIPICKEHCKFNLDGHRGYYIQIRQKYEEGIWSEWSELILVPAEIGPVQIEKINTGRLNLTGLRTISLFWKPRTKEEGNVNYHINVTYLPCSGITTHHSTTQNYFHENISGAAYNVTVISSNEAQAASPWSTVIEEDWAVIPFQNVTLFGNNLTVKWKGKKGKSSYCIAWKPSEMKEVSFSKLLENLNKNKATILTDNFLPMKCYKIYVHKISNNQSTVGTTYYFKPLFSIGPRNLTVMNVTVSSVLLKWDPFDLHECQGILQNWVINRKDHATNASNETYENSSVTQYLVEGLPHGFNYTFEVKGITVFGEQTGSSFKSVSSPWIVENTNKKLLEKTVGILAALLLVALGLVFSWFKIKQCICKDLPNPSNSTATTFTPSDNKYIVSPPHLVHTCFEEKNTEPLIIKTSMKSEAIETTVKETEMLDLVSTKELLDNELEMTDIDTEVEIDLQFEYRKQVAPITPINETDTSTQLFEKMKADVPHSSESSKENDTQLSLNDVNICTGEI